MSLDQLSPSELTALQQQLQHQLESFKACDLKLDLTRGKPGVDQLSLSNELDGILAGQYQMDNVDLRNYGGVDGLPSARALFAPILDASPDQLIIGGNASLTMMHQCMSIMHLIGLNGADTAWRNEGAIRFLCPVPGYDRHFAVCEQLGIEMINVDITNNGPDMDAVEALVSRDPSIKGIWCVPRFSNPTGCVYSAETVERLAGLGKLAGPDFRIFYDNAYAVHAFDDEAPTLISLLAACERRATEDSVFLFGSTSKITFAGAGVAFMASSLANRRALLRHFSQMTIGPDKVNQARHVKLLQDSDGLAAHMQAHAELLRPRFEAVLNGLRNGLAGTACGEWTDPRGGYFVSLDVRPGLAKKIVKMADGVGVKLTPAGATYPYGKDPQDRNLRIAPSVPSIKEIEQATEVLVCCVKLATVEQLLTG